MNRAPIPLLITLLWMAQALARPVLVPHEIGSANPEFQLPGLNDQTHSLQAFGCRAQGTP